MSTRPEFERRAIWGLMVGEEGKTRVPILGNYSAAGFDPDKDLLQSYGEGWRSGAFLPQERQLFGYPGGLLNDWALRTNLEGLYGAGDQLFASNCHGHAAATGHYAGRHAADYARSASDTGVDRDQTEGERARIHSLLGTDGDVDWRELNASIARVMQHHCGAIKSAELLNSGLASLRDIGQTGASRLRARNPHELMRCLEVLNVLTNAELVIHSCLARKASAEHLLFQRSDYPEFDPPEWHKLVTVRLEDSRVVEGDVPIDHYGSLKETYECENQAYVEGSGR
jgi:succinate dehydrogenase/fumarate reductase flavoprotein subunit